MQLDQQPEDPCGRVSSNQQPKDSAGILAAPGTRHPMLLASSTESSVRGTLSRDLLLDEALAGVGKD